MSFLSSNLMQEINIIQTPSAQIPKIFNRHEITQKTDRSLGINPLTEPKIEYLLEKNTLCSSSETN